MHTEDSGTVTLLPTETTEGICVYSCSVCGYTMRIEMLEKLPQTDGSTGSGEEGGDKTDTETGTQPEKPAELRRETAQSENVPRTEISTGAEELAQAVLTEEDRKQMEQGTDVTIILSVEDAGNDMPEADKAAIEGVLEEDYRIGQHLDISLFKVVGEDRKPITETAQKLTLTIAVPDALKNAADMAAHVFSVLRMHDSEATLLPDLDSDPDTITIETDRFSSYTIVYKENTEIGEDNQGGQGTEKDSEPKTGDSSGIELYATLAMIAGLSYVLLYFADRRRGMSEEKKNELTARLVRFARGGGRFRRMLAVAAIFLLLLYYHSIGKKTAVQWEDIYG